MRVLFDTNIVLDALLAREPHVRHAAALLNAVETGGLTGLLGATIITTIYYLAERAQDHEAAEAGVRQLLRLFEVAPVTRAVLEDALALEIPDFEDAVLHEAARYAGADAIVTRNRVDFATASLPIYMPEELLHIVQQRTE